MRVYRTYQFKLCPTKAQQVQLLQMVGCCRYVYNLLLHFTIEREQKVKKILTASEMKQVLGALVQKKSFLQRVPYAILEATVITLKSDITTHQKQHQAFPPFRKKGQQDFFTCMEGFSLTAQHVTIPSMTPIKYKNSRLMTAFEPKTLHISRKGDTWQMDLLIQKNISPPLSSAMRVVGIDVGIKDFAFLSTGVAIPNPQFYRTLEEKLKKEQKILARKAYKSNQWYKQKAKVQKIHQKITHARMNFLHQLSTYLVTQFDVIGIERLAIQSMVQNKRLAKSILDASWGIFITLLKYKAKEQGKQVIEVGRFYPSTQLCSQCGHQQFMPLHLRTYACRSCGYEVDRDYNAAKNIEKKAWELCKK